MKNFFSNIIKKAKSFVKSMTPTAKIRYVVISVITVAVAASLLVAVSLSKSEPENPTNPEDLGTGETVTIDFDTEITFEIGGESSSVGTTDSTASVTTDDASVTTDEVSGTEKPTSAEESTNVQTENNTEPIDNPEPQPTDPSQDYNPDPQPEDTTNTPVVNPKPTETTTRAPQTTAKPTETTTNAPQTTAKPTETTKPQETEPQPAGQFSLKEKTYDYNGANVTILQVENKSQQAYTITITGKFKDANGNTVKTESKTFEGFPAGWSNYFVFQPGVKYSSVTWDMKTEMFNSQSIANMFSIEAKTVSAQIDWALSDGSGKYIIPTGGPDEVAKLKKYVAVGCQFNNFNYNYQINDPFEYACDIVVFDKNGKICFVGTPGIQYNQSYSASGLMIGMPMFVTTTLWEDKDTYKLPNEYSSLTGIMSMKYIQKMQ